MIRSEGQPPRVGALHEAGLSHGDWTWIRSGFYLRWSNCNDPLMSAATLIVFSANPGLRARFEQLTSNSEWTSVLIDPFSLYVIVLDELWLQAEGIVRDVSDVFGLMERVRPGGILYGCFLHTTRS